MKRLACLGILIGLAVPMAALSATEPVEASMVVIGTVTVNPDGSVKAYTIKDMDKLAPGARQIVQATVPHWQFKPVETDGKSTEARTGMSLRIIADIGADNKVSVRVAGAQFGCNAYQTTSLLPMACKQDAAVEPIRRDSPAYPISAARAGVSGEVFLTLQIDRSGHVAQIAASQVNLYVRATHADEFRKLLADNAIGAAKHWTFRAPTTGVAATKEHWIVQVPVIYHLEGRRAARSGNGMCAATMTCDLGSEPKYGQWQAYAPGPVQVIPWAKSDSNAGAQSSNDAIAGNGALFVPDARFVLKTPLTGNGSQS